MGFIGSSKIHLYTGSFDPVHIGHLHVMKYLISKGKVIISPIKNPNKKHMFSIDQRLKILETALNEFFNKELEWGDIELDPNLTKYEFTIDQAKYIEKEYYRTPVLVFGSDYTLEDIFSFKEGDKLIDNYEIKFFKAYEKGPKLKELNSSDIRDMLLKGEIEKVKELYTGLPKTFDMIIRIFQNLNNE